MICVTSLKCMGDHHHKQNEPRGRKTPSTVLAVDPEGYWKKSPSWRFVRADKEHPRWKIDEFTIDEHFIDKLISYERQNWNDVLLATSGKRQGTRNHLIVIEELCAEAQDRLKELKLEDLDGLHSIRLTSRHRWWGFIIDGVFFFVWNDPDHEVCPVNRN